MRRKLMLLLMAAAVVAGASACEDNLTAGGGEAEQPTGQPTAPPTGEATPAPAQPPAGGVLASREVTDSGSDLLVEITGLRREGETATLQWRITHVSAAEPGGSWYAGSSMSGGLVGFDVSGVTLVDPVNAQRYLVARSGGEDGECACSRGTNFYMDEGDTAEFFANFAAPPAEVATINVEFPQFGAFTDVPVS